MEEVLRFSVDGRMAGKTVREVLRQEFGVSRRLLVRAKHCGEIRVNGEFVHVTRRLRQGDEVSVALPQEKPETLVAEPMPLDIRFEDEDLLIVAKQAGRVVHPTRNHPAGTLANGVVAYWQAKGEWRTFRPVNRLDKDTSGLLIVAKNQWAHEQCARLQKAGLLSRFYQAVVHGMMAEDQGEVNAPIGLKEGSIIERAVRPDGQQARTRYQVLARGAGMTWVKLQLLTGRTHQIRVHMSDLGHPLAGDDLYGGSRELIGRQALHAGELRFVHPRTNKLLCLSEPLPADMQALVDRVLSDSGGDKT